jgi:hypothetical protein
MAVFLSLLHLLKFLHHQKIHLGVSYSPGLGVCLGMRHRMQHEGWYGMRYGRSHTQCSCVDGARIASTLATRNVGSTLVGHVVFTRE